MKVKVLRGAGLVRGTSQSAAFDLAWNPAGGDGVDFYLAPGESLLVHTGIAVAIPDGKCGLVLPRSGLSAKIGLCVKNSPGLIDSDYRGEVMVALENRSRKEITREQIAPGDRIAQLLIVDFHSDIEIVDFLDDTDRGDGGFGSTGLSERDKMIAHVQEQFSKMDESFNGGAK